MSRSRAFTVVRPLLRAAAREAPRRCFNTTPALAVDSRRVAGRIQIRTIDDKIAEFCVNKSIEAHQVRLKGEDGKLSEPQWLDELLGSINTPKEYVLQLDPASKDPIPIVQIMCRQELIQRIYRQEDSVRNQKRAEKHKRPKQLELNWAISVNDLLLKMKQMKEFLEKGKKVELLFANRRGQRKASPEEAQALLETVRAKIDEAGAGEIVPMEGGILKRALLIVKMRGT